MPPPMTWKKGHGHSVKLAEDIGITRIAEGSFNPLLLDIGQAFQFVKPATANHTDHLRAHRLFLTLGRGDLSDDSLPTDVIVS